MITLTVRERIKEGKVYKDVRSIKIFHSMDKAKKYIVPVVTEMKKALADKRVPEIEILGASWDEEAEKALILSLNAIKTTENEL